MPGFEVENINCSNCKESKVFSIRWFRCDKASKEGSTKRTKLISLFKNPKYYHEKAVKCKAFKSMGNSKDWYDDELEVLTKRQLKDKGVDCEAL